METTDEKMTKLQTWPSRGIPLKTHGRASLLYLILNHAALLTKKLCQLRGLHATLENRNALFSFA
ncbi:hypothetical protein DDZ16_17940 [Marinilabilia rubra]|uniref:Uncharacterized protein n=1 Tax=Marinilabilia rubra TaxID=2162893 RepID=A0A2U2B4G2_9BACT|nr:hypothetical protein DDZ16_17940 [Marinilabilia rubra]